MDVTDWDVGAIPAGNLRVPRGEFAAVWIAVEQQLVEQPSDWYLAGMASTCRWLAGATVRPSEGAWYRQWAPVTEREGTAYEELIEAECLAVESLLAQRPVPAWLQSRPRWLDGIADTLDWAWRRTAAAPFAAGDRLVG